MDDAEAGAALADAEAGAADDAGAADVATADGLDEAADPPPLQAASARTAIGRTRRRRTTSTGDPLLTRRDARRLAHGRTILPLRHRLVAPAAPSKLALTKVQRPVVHPSAMNDPRRADTTPLDPPSDPPRDDISIARDDLLIDATDALVADPVDSGDGLTDTERYEGYAEAGARSTATTSLDTLMADELRDGETSDPNVAAEEGLTWVPPVDPVVVPDADDPQGLAIAAGFGTTAADEPFDADHHDSGLSDESEVTDRIREALRADARTSTLADRLVIATLGDVAVIRGLVDDVDDSDAIEEVVSEVAGIGEVRDETELTS